MKAVLFGLLFVLSTGIQAQELPIPSDTDKKAVKYYNKGQDALAEKRTDEALVLFEKAIDRDPEFVSARIMKASLLFRVKDYTNAEKEFLELIDLGKPFHPKVYYTLAISQKALDKYSAAAVNFDRYLNAKGRSDLLIEKARKYGLECRFAAEAVSNPLPFSPVSVGTGINTEVNEYLPAMTADGKTMIFTRRVGSYEFLFESTMINGVWSEAVPIEAINQHMEAGAHSISADGKLLVFTSCGRNDGYGSCDLYYSRRKNGTWTPPRNLGPSVNSAAWDSQPCLADNGRTIYFSSNRKGTLGKKDLWITRRGPDRRWTKPKNLGTDINTTGDEQSPFIHFDASTLYFTSNNHIGLGDYDIYKITRKDDTTWLDLTNLGYPINTKYHDGTLSIDILGQKGFITSDRHHRKDLLKDRLVNAETDIYEFDVPSEIKPNPSTFVSIEVVSKTTQKPIQAIVHVVEAASGKRVDRVKTDEDGQVLVVLPLNNDYAIQVSKTGFAFYSERIELTGVYSLDKPFIQKVELWKPEETEEAPIVLKNVLFESGSDELRSSSLMEIEYLFQLLTDKPSIFIEIRGHTDSVGNDEDNMALSLARAKKVRDVLLQKGIEQERISFKGFGETMPIADNDSEEGRRLNRRTEFLILK